MAYGIVILLLRARRSLTKYNAPDAISNDLPSVSVCIPARNEAHALSACLDRVLASDYEKLEVLVLDDESVDQTPTLIKSFAHAGVRFIAGKPLPEGWIGKNHALDTLAREASGDIVLFLDVDVHISTRTISTIVHDMPQETRLMSFIPERRDTLRANALFGHLRYFWDMLQVGLGGVSAVASIWAVRRDWLLEEHRGFETIRGVIRPELALIENSNTHNKLFLGSDKYGISYEKRWRSQVESSQRLIIPSIRQYGAAGILTVVWLVLWGLTTPLLVLELLIGQQFELIPLFVVASLAGYVVYFCYLRTAWQSRAWLGALFWWWASLQELILTILSMVRYTTKTVTWKGRSIHAKTQNNDYRSV